MSEPLNIVDLMTVVHKSTMYSKKNDAGQTVALKSVIRPYFGKLHYIITIDDNIVDIFNGDPWQTFRDAVEAYNKL